MSFYSHQELVDITANKVASIFRCGMVLKEPRSMALSFSPDVFAVKKGGMTFQFEIKVSRSDFLKDKNKPHRITPSEDVGVFRYYVCPYGMISPDDPALVVSGVRWGLVWVDKGGKFHIKRGPTSKGVTSYNSAIMEECYKCLANRAHEVELMYSYHRSMIINAEENGVKIMDLANRINRDSNNLKQLCVKMR